MWFPWSDDGRFETVLAAGAEIIGDLKVKGPARIHGRVEGDIRCEDHLVVGRGGEVRGGLFAPVVTVGGHVAGKIEAAERVELLDGATVNGTIQAPRLTVAEGAIYEGTIHMGQHAAHPAKGPAPRGSSA
jgi:cytoskeletal protein CcmA (bactofilin family)